LPAYKVIDSILVFAGFIIITVAILLYLNLLRNMKMVKEHVDKTTAAILRAYIVLMFFFLICYSFIGASLFLDIDLNNINIIGILLFFVSIFTVIGIVAQVRFADCINKSNMQIMRSLIGAVEVRDIALKGHSVHVRAIALLILDNLPKHLSKKIDRQKFEYACLMHDLGKLGIPDNVLNKESSLTDAEWSLIKEHPKIGVHIINDLNGFAEIKEWILYHHERMDGKGYYGITGNDIPLASKIICIADAYSAIVMNRLYREAKGHDEAIKILKENAGTQFDPELVDIFQKICKKKVTEIESKFTKMDEKKDRKDKSDKKDKKDKNDKNDKKGKSDRKK